MNVIRGVWRGYRFVAVKCPKCGRWSHILYEITIGKQICEFCNAYIPWDSKYNDYLRDNHLSEEDLWKARKELLNALNEVLE